MSIATVYSKITSALWKNNPDNALEKIKILLPIIGAVALTLVVLLFFWPRSLEKNGHHRNVGHNSRTQGAGWQSDPKPSPRQEHQAHNISDTENETNSRPKYNDATNRKPKGDQWWYKSNENPNKEMTNGAAPQKGWWFQD